MMAADITNIGEVERGDEVVLIGFQKESRITVAFFGENEFANELRITGAIAP